VKPRIVKSVQEFEGRYSVIEVLVDADEAPRSPWDSGADLAVVGHPAPRADGLARITAKARYTVDVRLPGMLHAVLLRSPVAHARVRSLDLAAARRAPGVRAVIGPDDAIGTGATLPPGFSGSIVGGALSSEPQYVGHGIAAVAADTPEQARAALATLALELEPLPFDADLAKALYDQRFTEDLREEVRGDPDAALAAADVTVELEVTTEAQLHTALEPHAALAEWTAEDELTVWLSTQAMYVSQTELATVFGLPKPSVRIVSEYVGGGFGAKVSAGVEGQLAAELARRAGRPVRLVNSRHEEQLTGGHRPATRQTVRLGARRDGTLVAIESEVAAGMGVGGLVMPYGAVPMSLYRCENARSIVAPVRLNLRAGAAFRAPGVTEVTAAFEQAMDELAGALGIDPLELRRDAHADVEQRTGDPFSSKALLACYDRVAELSNWADREQLRAPSEDGLLRGMGCASQMWFGGGGPAAHATVRIDGSGLVQVFTGIQDPGTGSLTSARLVAAEELGVPPDRVRVRGGDTRHNVYGPIAGGSGTTGSVMPAVRSAAAKARGQLLELAADAFEMAPEDLSLRDGRIRSRDNVVDAPYTVVTDRLGNSAVDGWGARGPNPTQRPIQTFGCQVAQVAIDPGTGEVVVEKVWAVHDVGRIINPLTASSQVEGGIIQGVGMALFEERAVDPTLGAPTNATLDDYKVPTLADVPEIVLDFVELADPATDVGAKGLGEPPIVPTPAAIANAFAHATGRRCARLPLTRANVLEALA
jgi:xanthine dehydrogenase YagR molybdenum-binding subunit